LRWAQAGETIVIGSRDAQRALETAANLSATAGADKRISGTENRFACSDAEIVVLTVPFAAHAETLKHIKPSLRAGQILVDTTVPLAASIAGKPTRTLGVWQGSAAQQAAELVPDGVTVVAAFHNLAADLLQKEDPIDCDVIVCSDDKNAGKRVRELARKIPGVRALDGGRLENARIVEQITAVLIGLNIRYKGHSGLRITGLPDDAFKN
jgi:hypothetical protein